MSQPPVPDSSSQSTPSEPTVWGKPHSLPGEEAAPIAFRSGLGSEAAATSAPGGVQPLPWLLFVGVVLLAVGSALVSHIRIGQLIRRSDEMGQALSLAKGEMAMRATSQREKKDRTSAKLLRRTARLDRELEDVRKRESATSKLAVGLVDKLIRLEALLDSRLEQDAPRLARLAALEKRQQALLPRAKFDSQLAWSKVHLARRTEIKPLAGKIKALQTQLAEDAKKLSALRKSLPVLLRTLRKAIEGKADRSSMTGLARKSDLRGLARKDALKGLARKRDLDDLAPKRALVGVARTADLKKLEATLRVLAKGIQHMLTSVQQSEQRIVALRAEVERLKQKIK